MAMAMRRMFPIKGAMMKTVPGGEDEDEAEGEDDEDVDEDEDG